MVCNHSFAQFPGSNLAFWLAPRTCKISKGQKIACGEGVNWGRTEPIQVPTNIGQSEPTTTHQSVHLEGREGWMDRWLDGWMSVDRKTHFYQVIRLCF
jgi:hypothetical protein